MTTQEQMLCGQCGGYFYATAALYCCFDGTELLPCQQATSASFGVPLQPSGKECRKCHRKYTSLTSYCGIDGTELSPWFDASSMSHDSSPKAEEKPRQDADSQASLLGQTIDGKFLVKAPFAQGGMAMLYEAQQISVDRPVMLKVMSTSASFTQEELQRFEQEAKLLARLNHPNIVSVYDFGFLDARTPYLAMEFVAGLNLKDRVEKFGLSGPREALQIMKQVCQGLQEAHKRDIVHRDLKPENIILQDDSERPDWVKIVDFGIAHALGNESKRLTRSGVMIGTPEFMAPELFNEQRPDHRCDIYSLGVVMFELLTGRLPFQGADLATLIARVLTEPVPTFSSIRPEIPPGTPIEQMVLRCLQRDPANRFQSVNELISVVQDLSRATK